MSLLEVIEKSRELRQDNKLLKLLKLIWMNPGIARRDIGSRAKISKGAVTMNISQLTEAGYVTEGKAVSDTECRLGRTSAGLYIASDFFYSIGIYLAYDNPRAVLFDAAGETVRSLPLEVHDGEHCFHENTAELKNAVETLLRQVPRSRVIALGMAVTGIIDFDSGDVFASAPFKGGGAFNLKTFIRENFGLECFLINVSHLHPIMEKKWGGAKEMENFITVDDSCTAGFFLNGKLYRGWQKHAGELSLMKVTETREFASDGRNGLVELKSAFYKLKDLLKEMIANGARPKILEFMESPDGEISIEMVLRSIEAGDKFLEMKMAERYEAIAEAVVNTAYMLNPEAIFLEDWTRRCPQCTIEVVERKMSSYGLSGWRLKSRILSSECAGRMVPHAVSYLAVESVFDDAVGNRDDE